MHKNVGSNFFEHEMEQVIGSEISCILKMAKATDDD